MAWYLYHAHPRHRSSTRGFETRLGCCAKKRFTELLHLEHRAVKPVVAQAASKFETEVSSLARNEQHQYRSHVMSTGKGVLTSLASQVKDTENVGLTAQRGVESWADIGRSAELD